MTSSRSPNRSHKPNSRARRLLLNAQQQVANLKRLEAGAAEKSALGLTKQRATIVQEINNATRVGGEVEQANARRRLEIAQRLKDLAKEEAAQRTALPKQVTAKWSEDEERKRVQLLGQQEAAMKRQLQAGSELYKLSEKQTEAEARFLKEEETRLQKPGAKGRGKLEDAELAKINEQQARWNRQLQESTVRLGEINTSLAEVDAKIGEGQKAVGLSRTIADIRKETQQLLKELTLLGSGERLSGLNAMNPQFQQMFEHLQQIRGVLEAGDIVPEEEQAKIRQATELLVKMRGTMEQFGAGGGLPKAMNFEEATKQLPLFEKTMISAFSGIGRRFQTALQFSISGALIYSAQRLVREFFKTAFEVERAFADIGTALEFDIEAPRGSAEFQKVLEEQRQEILKLASTYNVLPTQANEAAFVMIARFKDTETAMKALRAQLLAVKISGIDMSETLRALTAVAETFANAIVENAGVMDNDNLLKIRGAVAAANYGKALDVATLIQQKYGVQVEDTLEGTAQLAEVFRQLGFTLEQTSIIVGLTSRQLGQTGAASAERLARSIGQLTSPQIQQQLLSLAKTSEEFWLTASDFRSGEAAWKAIVAQYERLLDLEPATARRMVQIIGQRRETAAVAAALGTAALQEEFLGNLDEAAGAAEDRFAILRQTVVEIVAGIGTEFERLAQNLAKLGVITPLKTLLSAFRQILTVTNEILEKIAKFLEFLNKIKVPLTNIGLGRPRGSNSGMGCRPFQCAADRHGYRRYLQDHRPVQDSRSGCSNCSRVFPELVGLVSGRGLVTVGGVGQLGQGIGRLALQSLNKSLVSLGRNILNVVLFPVKALSIALLRLAPAIGRVLVAAQTRCGSRVQRPR